MPEDASNGVFATQQNAAIRPTSALIHKLSTALTPRIHRMTTTYSYIPPLPPPYGMLTKAHFKVIQKAKAITSSLVTSG